MAGSSAAVAVSSRVALNLDAVAGPAHPAGGEERVLGKEPVGAELLEDFGPQPEHALVVRHRREQLGLEDDARPPGDVVVHAVGVDHGLALAEDDVAFHVDLEGTLPAWNDSPRWSRLEDVFRPDHQPIGRDVDRVDGDRSDGHVAEPVDDQVHARVDQGDALVGDRIDEPFGLDRHVASWEEPDAPRSLGPGTGRRLVRGRVLGADDLAARCRAGGRRAASVDQRRLDRGRSNDLGDLHVDGSGRGKPVVPGGARLPDAAASRARIDGNVALEIRQHAAEARFGRLAPFDPEQGLVALGRV